ncbi:NAD(P)-binding domain-containing protein [Microbacterium alcoholitolerans]|uniref:NAD(P)-binding domain-containing protein n=1 Tax=unclassified Microbacterium TaxID=2609290 RepID=UPI003D182DED
MTSTAKLERDIEAAHLFDAWLEKARLALETPDVDRFTALFDDDGYWMDYLAFTWRYRTFEGHAAIREAAGRTLAPHPVRSVAVSAERARPRLARRSGTNVLEGFFDYETAHGAGTAYVRLRLHDDGADPTVWVMLTTLQSVHGYAEQSGTNRPRGHESDDGTMNWLDRRNAERAFTDRDPEVIIIGGGHSALTLGARLRQMGVDALILEKNHRIGDNWRKRYHSLTLHNEVATNTLPYMPYPTTWPSFLPKDKLAQWLEAYAEAMELNVWTDCEVVRAERDKASGLWTVRIRRSDGSITERAAPQVVLSTGGHSGVPKLPRIPGLEDFAGRAFHSSEYHSADDHAGEQVVIIGVGSSAHDIAQDLYENGAGSVTMIQRNPSAVISLDPCGTMVYAAYSDDLDPADVDFVQAATPYPMLKSTYQWLTKKTCELDRALIDGLESVGFRTDFEPDNTGFHMKYLRKGGGYYINAGCSELIIDGKIGIRQAADIERVEAGGLRMTDGSLHPADTLVLASGYENQQEGVRQLFGDDVADRVGPIWGFDENHVMRNMWVRTAQDGFWVMGGSLMEARLYSTYLAVQIRADLLGILPREGLA